MSGGRGSAPALHQFRQCPDEVERASLPAPVRLAVMDKAHLFTVARYIVLNPAQAGLDRKAQDWESSSVRSHLAGRDDELVMVKTCSTTFRVSATCSSRRMRTIGPSWRSGPPRPPAGRSARRRSSPTWSVVWAGRWRAPRRAISRRWRHRRWRHGTGSIGEYVSCRRISGELNRLDPSASWKGGYFGTAADAVAIANKGRVGLVLQAPETAAPMVTSGPIPGSPGRYTISDTGVGATYEVDDRWIGQYVSGGVWQ